MTSRHLATGAAVALCLTLPVPAFAAKRPVPKSCKLLQDPADDAGPLTTAGGPQTSDPALDVRYADIAADARTLTVVWGVKQLSTDPSLSAPGRRWRLTYTVGPTAVVQTVVSGPHGTVFDGDATGVIDAAKNEVRMWIPLTKIKGVRVAKGAVLRNISISTDAGTQFPRSAGIGDIQPYPFVSPGDTGRTDKIYTVGAPSCVAIGK